MRKRLWCVATAAASEAPCAGLGLGRGGLGGCGTDYSSLGVFLWWCALGLAKWTVVGVPTAYALTQVTKDILAAISSHDILQPTATVSRLQVKQVGCACWIVMGFRCRPRVTPRPGGCQRRPAVLSLFFKDFFQCRDLVILVSNDLLGPFAPLVCFPEHVVAYFHPHFGRQELLSGLRGLCGLRRVHEKICGVFK